MQDVKQKIHNKSENKEQERFNEKCEELTKLKNAEAASVHQNKSIQQDRILNIQQDIGNLKKNKFITERWTTIMEFIYIYILI